jgi:tetratricopeptide (TPR) repeat protein
LAEGEFALVRKHLERALRKEKSSNVGHHDLYAMLADAAVQQRNPNGMLKYAPLLEEEALDLDHSLYLAVAHRAWGVAHRLKGDFEEAEARLGLARELFRDLDTRWQLGRTHFELGELAAARSDPSLAVEQYTASLKLHEEMGALPDAAKTRAAMASLAGRD